MNVTNVVALEFAFEFGKKYEIYSNYFVIIGCIELIDVSSQLPNLKYNHGLSSWKVCV